MTVLVNKIKGGGGGGGQLCPPPPPPIYHWNGIKGYDYHTSVLSKEMVSSNSDELSELASEKFWDVRRMRYFLNRSSLSAGFMLRRALTAASSNPQMSENTHTHKQTKTFSKANIHRQTNNSILKAGFVQAWRVEIQWLFNDFSSMYFHFQGLKEEKICHAIAIL